MIKVVTLEQLLRQVAGQRIVFTNGCFDLLHVGHLRTLQWAKNQGDVLVVGLNSDAGVRRLKGPTRPLTPAAERAELLAGFTCVDYVVVFEEDTPAALLARLRPAVHVKGGDYRPDELPEAELVRSFGGEVRVTPLVAGRSTSRLEEMLREAPADGE